MPHQTPESAYQPTESDARRDADYSPLDYETPGPRPEDPCLCGNTAWGLQGGRWTCGAGHVAPAPLTDDESGVDLVPDLDGAETVEQPGPLPIGLRAVEMLNELPEWARKQQPAMVLPPALVVELRECQYEATRIEQRKVSLLRGYCHTMGIDLEHNSVSYDLSVGPVVTVTPNA